MLEAGRVGDGERVGDEPGERIGRGVGGFVARAVTAMIENHHRVIACQGRHVIGEVLLRTTEAVNQQQPRPLTYHLDREPHPVVHRDAHAYMLTRTGCTAPGGGPGPARPCT